jgi:hypothetical protein
MEIHEIDTWPGLDPELKPNLLRPLIGEAILLFDPLQFWARTIRSVRVTRDRCYDHTFLRFSTIFGEKIGVFLKNQCYP